MISEKDELFHEPSRNMLWNESFYFNFFDFDRGGFGAVSRVGLSPNQKKQDGMLAIFLEDDRALLWYEETEIESKPGELKVGPLNYSLKEHFKEWKLSFNGDMYIIDNKESLREPNKLEDDPPPQTHVEVEMGWVPYNEPFDYHGHMKRKFGLSFKMKTLKKIIRFGKDLKEMSQARHYEQAGDTVGVIKFEGKEVKLKGYGERDHSWGVRAWHVPDTWRWFSIQFGEDIALNAARVTALGSRVQGGYIYINGNNYPIDNLEIKSRMRPDNVAHTGQDLTIYYDNGKVLEITGKVISVIPFVREEEGVRTVINEAFTEFSIGARKGYGISEYLDQYW